MKMFFILVTVVGLITGFSVIFTNSPFGAREDGLTPSLQSEFTQSESSKNQQSQDQSENSDVSKDTEISPITPYRLRIPKIAVSSVVEYVGMDAEGRMDVPKADENVAWFKLGVRPGDLGSAVLAGHFDSKTGGPAVFYDLTDLEVGDTVEVVDDAGSELSFVVTQTATYKDADFPIDTVFAQSDARRLNLITCAGQYSQQQSNYSDRFVVFTELVE